MPAKKEYFYDENGNWVYIGDVFTPPKPSESDAPKDPASPKKDAEDKGDNPVKKKVPKTTETAVKENFVLEGTVNLAITPETLIIRIGDTVNMQGFGKFLSGNFYVVSRAISLTNEGYQITLEVMRKDFSRSLKK